MFYTIKYQTGELDAVIVDMNNGKIPLLEVDNTNELNWVIDRLREKDIYRIDSIKPDKLARDAVSEPDFEFRLAFHNKNDLSNVMYIDIFEEPIPDEDYDSIWGD